MVRAAALALTVLVLTASGSPAQEGAGPGVVPPSAAYIGEESEPSGHSLPRWRVEAGAVRTLSVFLSPPPVGRPDFWSEVERAVGAWNDVPDLPLSLRRTARADAADVRMGWIRRFDANQAGTTDWQTDGGGWLTSAVVTLAVEHVDGTPMSDEFLLLVALHELGHAIGLPHSEIPSDVMHPGNRSRRLSGRDIRSAQRLYNREGPGEAGNP